MSAQSYRLTLDFRTVNTLWAGVLVETWVRCGLCQAVISPGSRSTPLTLALAQDRRIEAISVLDERSAAFYALGLARRSRLPVALLCTSGTAAANFFPAVIEAREAGVPLLVLTADRPAELRDCRAGQAIDQVGLYGSYPNWQLEMAVPEAAPELLGYARETAQHAWERALFPGPGPVHLNLPFREPLAPVGEQVGLAPELITPGFFDSVSRPMPVTTSPEPKAVQRWLEACWRKDRGLILAGPEQPADAGEYVKAVAKLARVLGWPILVDALSPLRHWKVPGVSIMGCYDWIVRAPGAAELRPDAVLCLGDLPTSKRLREWLRDSDPSWTFVSNSERNRNPLAGRSRTWRCSSVALSGAVSETAKRPRRAAYGLGWAAREKGARRKLDKRLAGIKHLFEGKVSWLLPRVLPRRTPVFVASSMPVRDLEFFWGAGDDRCPIFFNRGANGIDGTLSTALGVMHGQAAGVLLTGDLALLHDTNGFLASARFRGHLTILLINNQGGGIFEMLPIAQINPPFEEFFATPQRVDFAALARAYGVEHLVVESWGRLEQLLRKLPETGVRVLEIRTDRKRDAATRKELFQEIGQAVP